MRLSIGSKIRNVIYRLEDELITESQILIDKYRAGIWLVMHLKYNFLWTVATSSFRIRWIRWHITCVEPSERLRNCPWFHIKRIVSTVALWNRHSFRTKCTKPWKYLLSCPRFRITYTKLLVVSNKIYRTLRRHTRASTGSV